MCRDVVADGRVVFEWAARLVLVERLGLVDGEVVGEDVEDEPTSRARSVAQAFLERIDAGPLGDEEGGEFIVRGRWRVVGGRRSRASAGASRLTAGRLVDRGFLCRRCCRG